MKSHSVMRKVTREFSLSGSTLLLILVLVLGTLFSLSLINDQAVPFASSEVQFADPSFSGLSIVPASCPSVPSNPDYPHNTCVVTLPPGEGPMCLLVPEDGIGSIVTLKWNSRGGGTSGVITPGVGSVSGASGYKQVLVSQPTAYTLSMANGVSCVTDVINPDSGGGCSGEACVGIDPPEVTFWADRYLVQSGDTTELHWTTTNVNYCVLEDYGSTEGDVTDYSTTTDPINSQTTFVLTCVGDDETIIDDDLTIDIIPVFCETGVPGCNNPGEQSSATPNSQVALAGQAAAAGAAETEAGLSATIRAAILSDSRSADMTQAEIDAMVSALVQEAEGEGVSSYDILWRPQEEPQLVPQDTVATCNFLCMLNQAFGLDGSDVAIPIGLGITAAILLFVIGSLLLHRHGHHPVAGDLSR